MEQCVNTFKSIFNSKSKSFVVKEPANDSFVEIPIELMPNSKPINILDIAAMELKK